MPRSGPKTRSTNADVAKLAGVSSATVSYVISNRPGMRIPEATRERVRAAAAELGYRPNAIASALATGRTGLIALWIRDAQSTYYANVIKQFERKAQPRTHQIVINLAPPTSNLVASEKVASSFPFDGMIFYDQSKIVNKLLDEKLHMVMPIVATGNYSVIDDRIDTVSFDMKDSCYEAMAHLIERGHRRIAFLIPEAIVKYTDPRLLIYRETMGQAGLSEELITTSHLNRSAAYQAIRDYVPKHGCPEAIFCLNDELATGVYCGLGELGVRIPDDVAIVGCDGFEEGEYLSPPLSTIVLPIERLCTLAWQMLDRRFRDPQAPVEHIMLQSYFQTRKSSL